MISGDIYARSFCMLGKIYEQQGDIAKVIVHYEKFLSIWKDSDLRIAEVEDFRERLKSLTKNQQVGDKLLSAFKLPTLTIDAIDKKSHFSLSTFCS